MTAVIVGINDLVEKSPEEILKAFFSVYSPASVKNSLWEVFMTYVMRKTWDDVSLIADDEMMLLFDDLIALVAAVDDLSHRNGLNTAG